MKRVQRITLVLAIAMFLAQVADAQIPRTISYQGVLTDAVGNFIGDGNHQLLLRLYDAPGAPTPIYTETQNLLVIKGIFNASIGSVNPISPAVTFDRAYFLGVSVDGGAELSPRTALSAVPYALHASVADALAPGATGVVTSVNGSDGAIVLEGGGGTTVNKVGNTISISSTGGGGTGIQGVQNGDGTLQITSPNGPVATINVAANSISTTKITDGTIANADLSDASVTSSKIADGTITMADLSSGIIPTTLPPSGPAAGDLTGTYPNPTIAANAITSGKILDATITAADLAPGIIPAQLWTATGSDISNSNTGNVGVGIATPQAPLHVRTTTSNRAMIIDGATNMYAQWSEAGTPRGYLGSFSGAATDVDFGTVSGNATGKVNFVLQATPKMTIDSTGFVGIGTVLPSRPLQVVTASPTTGTVKFDQNSPTANVYTLEATSSGLGTAGHFVVANPATQNAALVAETYGNSDAVVFLTRDSTTQASTVWTGTVGRGPAALFYASNALNTNAAVIASMDGTGWALQATNQNATNGASKGLYASSSANNGGIGFQLANGQMIWSVQNGYLSNGIVDDAVLIVTTPGNYTLPVGRNGQQVWVINNSGVGGVVNVTNIAGAGLGIANGRGQHYMFLTNVSAVNWVPIQ